MVPRLSSRKVKQVACGDYHTLCLLEDKTVYMWGGSLHKDKKERGKNNEMNSHSVNAPQPISALYGLEIEAIECGDFHSCALDSNGHLYTWGGGSSQSYNKGQCGHGHNKSVEQPLKVKALDKKRVTKIACGGFHTLALTSENELYAWGACQLGECGNGEFYDTYLPKLVKFPSEDLSKTERAIQEELGDDDVLDMYLKESIAIKSIAAGGHHSFALTTKGKLYAWGFNSHGQLGLRCTQNKAKP